MADFLLGALAALVHFGGLWWAVRRLAGSGRVGTRLPRMAATGAAFGVLAARGPEALALGSAGFLLARAGVLGGALRAGDRGRGGGS